MRQLVLIPLFTCWLVGPALAAPGGKAPATPPARPAASPAAAFGKAVAPTLVEQPIERRLHSDAFEASSFLWNDWNRFQENYHPNYVGDDDAKTGWVEGAEGSGAGQWLRIAVTPLEQTSKVRLRIRNGYQKSGPLFKANARVKELEVRLVPGNKAQVATLADKQGWQELVIEQPAGPLREIELHVRSVYEGSKYEDLVISDVQVFATSRNRDNPAFEKSKRQNLLDWRKARLAAAKLFKAGGGNALPLHSSYRATRGAIPAVAADLPRGDMAGLIASAAADPAFAEWKDSLAAAAGMVGDLDSLVPAQISPMDSATLPSVDGFETLDLGSAAEGYVNEGAMRLPLLGHVSAFSATKLRVLDQKGRSYSEYGENAWGKNCRDASWVKRVKASEATGPDRVAGLLVARCGETEGREGPYITRADQLMVFAKDGRLALVVGNGYLDAYRWEAGGKIAGGRALLWDSVVDLRKGQVASK